MTPATRRALVARLLVLSALALVAVPTLTPTPGAPTSSGLCVFCGSLGGVDFVLNVALFVPLGAATWLLTRSIGRAVLAGLVVSAVIEVLQVRVVEGRDAALGDVIANTLGSLAGAVLAAGIRHWRHAGDDWQRRLTALAGLLTSALVAASAVGLQPIQNRYALYLQWTPARVNEEPFRGRMYSIDVNGRTLQKGEYLGSYQLLDSVTRSVRARATFSAEVPPTPRPAIIGRIVNDLEEGFQVAQLGTAIVFRSFTLASKFKFRTPLIGLDRVFDAPGGSGDSVITADVRSSPGSIEVMATRGQQTSSVVVARTVGLGWTALLPLPVAVTPRWWPANAAWLMMLLLPVSLLAARSAGPARVAVRGWPVLLVVAILAAVPAATGLSPLALREWLGVAAGIALGALLAPRLPNAER